MAPRGAFPATLVVALVALAAITRAPALIVASAGAAIAWLVVAITGRLALVGVEVDLRVAPERLVAGERCVATVTITNRKPLPLPWLEARLQLPEGVEPADAVPGRPKSGVAAGFAPGAHERVMLRFPLRAAQRGAYAIGPIRLRAGDWLGFTQDERTAEVQAAIVAYPAPLSVVDRHLPSLRALAETATKRGLVPDPLRFRGVREHRRGDARASSTLFSAL